MLQLTQTYRTKPRRQRFPAIYYDPGQSQSNPHPVVAKGSKENYLHYTKEKIQEYI